MSSSQFSDRSDWKRVSFSLDLVRQAKYYVEFLKYVEERVGFREPEALKKAIYRYEKHWLPFCATETDLDLKKYFPPTDVAWVWYCHMLNPVAYRHDTEAYCGRLIDHSLCSLFDIKAKQEITRPKWEQFRNNKNNNNIITSSSQSFSFDHTSENSIGSDRDEFDVFESKLSFDLLNVSSRLNNFSYQISLPHFNSFEYLTFCVDRYKKFLFLLKHKPVDAAVAPTDHDLLTTVPCNGIEVIWHSHLLSPHVYASGTTKILGKLLPHYDSFPDDNSSSRSSNESIQKLWRETFDEEFFFPGSMYRGDRPTPAVFSTNNELEYDLFFVRNGSIKLSETSLTCKKETKHADKAKYRMLVTQNRRPIYEGDLSLSESLRFMQAYSFENFSESSLNLRVVVRYRESLADKLVSTFKYLPKHDGSCDVYFDPRLIVPEKGTENQYFTYCIRDPRGNEFALDQRWRIETRVLRTIRFTVFQEPFQAIDMKYIINDYEVFDLHREDFSGEKGEGIRAQHSISSMINNYEETLFVAEILHIVSLQWSSVRIMKDNQVYATSHLIGPSQLPPKSKIKYEKSYLTLDPRDERAVLVRNLAGDYAILIGKWVENKDIVNSLKMKKDSRKANHQKQNGRLEVKLYQLEKKTSTSTPTTSIEIPLDAPFEFESASTKTRVDLRTGNIEVKFLKDAANTLEIESNLAVVFGVALLHVMLQPKPGPYYSEPRMSRDKISQINPYYSSSTDIPPSSLATSTSTSTTITTTTTRGAATSDNISRHSISNSSIRMTSYKLFSCIGYIDLVYLDSFFNECYKITHEAAASQIEKGNNNNNNNKIKNNYNKNIAKEIPKNYYHWFPDAFVNFLNGGR